jgi:solute carrier family 45 protein 1/2/4
MGGHGGSNKGEKLRDDPVFEQIRLVREEHARNQAHDYSHVFMKKSRFSLIRLSFIIIGIQFAYSAETAFASPILLEVGVTPHFMTLAWIFSPMIGFFMSPIMGSVSDKCRSLLGRRRPFMIGMSIFILIGKFICGYSSQPS